MSAPTAQSPQHAGSDRIPALDGVRGLAIGAVLLHHLFEVKLLWMGVDLFFVLSGFLITGILVRSKGHSFSRYIGHFYQRRAQRILPPYVLILALNVMVYGSGFFVHYWYYYIGGMNFLIALGKPFLFSLPLWSLAVEEQFYLLWPFAVFMLPRKMLVPCAAGLIVLAPVLRYAFSPYFPTPWVEYSMLPFRMDCLAVGAVFALVWPWLGKQTAANAALRNAMALGGAAAGIAALGGLLWMSRHGINTIGNTRLGNTFIYLCSLTCVSYVMLLALLGFLRPLFTLRPLVWLGTVSYAVYLSHLGFYVFLVEHAHWRFAGAWSLLFSLLYSAASWYWMEKPILRLGRGDQRTVASQFRPQTL